jgi:hypothetical protein
MIILQKTALKQDEKLKSKTFEISPFYVKNSNNFIIMLVFDEKNPLHVQIKKNISFLPLRTSWSRQGYISDENYKLLVNMFSMSLAAY